MIQIGLDLLKKIYPECENKTPKYIWYYNDQMKDFTTGKTEQRDYWQMSAPLVENRKVN